MLAATPAGGEPTDFAEIVSRARAYVVEYEHALSEVRAEERYVQQVVDADGRVVETLALVSEFMVFQLRPAEDWFAFREVIEMDGQPRHDPDFGFDELRLAPSSDVVRRAREMSAASARHNLGDLVRTINLPTFALAFLRPVNRDHVRFEKLGAEVLEGRHTCVIGYVEVGRPTLIATPGGDDLVTRGRFWVVPADGRIVRSELITGDARSGWIGVITVTYRPSAVLGIWYIAEMAELYTRWPNGSGERVTATATYSKLRRAEEQQLARLRPPLDPLPAEPVLLPAAADVRPPDLPAAVLAPRSERHVGMLVGGHLGLGLGPHRLLVGGHLEAASRVAGLSIRPGVEWGVGAGLSAVELNVELKYRSLLRRGLWAPFLGVGPALVRTRLDGTLETGLYLNLLGGFDHPSGVFLEFRVRPMAAGFKAVVGYSPPRKPRPESARRP